MMMSSSNVDCGLRIADCKTDDVKLTKDCLYRAQCDVLLRADEPVDGTKGLTETRPTDKQPNRRQVTELRWIVIEFHF